MQLKTYRKIILSSIIPVIGAILTLSYNIYQNTQERRIENIRQEVTAKVVQANSLNAAMDGIRKQYAINAYFCKNIYLLKDRNQEIYNLATSHFSANYNLVQVNYETQLIFGDQIYQKVLAFLVLIENDNYNICSQNAPTDDEMRILQSQINELMRQSITKSENQLNRLR